VVSQEFIKSVEAWATRARLWTWVIGTVVVIATSLTAAVGYLGTNFGQTPLFQLIPAVLITAASSLWLVSRLRLRRNGSQTTNQVAPSDRELLPSSSEQCLVPQDIFLEINDDPSIRYKRKLRIRLQNKSRKHLIVRAATWQSRAETDIEVRPLNNHPWQIRRPDSSWSAEMAEVAASPNAVLRTWIGLHEQADHDDVRQRIVQGTLGALTIPMVIDNLVVEQRISFGPIRI
jgi:hypothetical protein